MTTKTAQRGQPVATAVASNPPPASGQPAIIADLAAVAVRDALSGRLIAGIDLADALSPILTRLAAIEAHLATIAGTAR